MDPKLALFGTIAKMMGVSPEQLAHVMDIITTAGERLERIERKVDALAAGATNPGSASDLAGVLTDDRPGYGANGAGRGV